ncbi:hypothetical protein DPMN_153685 [Dreissena polymorpha]|uniref:Uncharacterized protein n=1 Tax=Dreissena polymorpha TaxID=45954 RepID=A0A9D4J6A6_DREPO|nr:hypothetical protein DPMN_153685 [Dreissena polymorpha]
MIAPIFGNHDVTTTQPVVTAQIVKFVSRMQIVHLICYPAWAVLVNQKAAQRMTIAMATILRVSLAHAFVNMDLEEWKKHVFLSLV